MEYRHSTPDDIWQMKHLWQVCFGDEPAYIDFYYEYGYSPQNTFVAVENGLAVSMITLLPVTLLASERCIQGRYVYAVATIPEFRGQGLMRNLEAYAVENVQKLGVDFLTLVPANASLFTLYERIGYQPFTSLSYQTLELSSYKSKRMPTAWTRMGGRAFLAQRALFLQSLGQSVCFGKSLNPYFLDELLFNNCQMVWIHNALGSGYLVYYIEHDQAYIRELTVSPACLQAAASELAQRMQVKTVHLKAWRGWCDNILTRPYSMVKWLHAKPNDVSGGYMNLMLD